ncbi:MAG: carboxylating nicotinate-nucleotide diphosphorylase [Deltaproteobacteria bacterium]|nr:carboxylating nicotinate-nucleotide diphosphorylase [Deltaproteobacteria bacterium]
MSAADEIAPPPGITLRQIVRLALEEDLGRGDITSWATVPAKRTGAATLRAREACVLAGMPVVREVFRQVDEQLQIALHVADGSRLEAGSTLARLEGSARSLLAGERVALNFLQRLSGVASLTRAHVDALPAGSTTRIADTRKTTPGLRALERYAVRCGGGHNHRDDLSSAVMIKDNHIAACGGLERAIAAAQANAPHTSRIECEVDTPEQFTRALAAGADIIMLDNFSDEAVASAVKECAGRAILEASGGIDLSRVRTLALAGVDVISVGALTHSAPAVDLGLDWE